MQGDSVEGFGWNGHDILSLCIVARKAQLYLRKAHADPDATVARLDDLERAMGSREAFAGAFDPLLLVLQLRTWGRREPGPICRGLCLIAVERGILKGLMHRLRIHFARLGATVAFRFAVLHLDLRATLSFSIKPGGRPLD